MSRIYEIYIDFLIIKTWIENFVLLGCVLVTMNKKIQLRRLITGAGCISIGNIVFFLFCPKRMIWTIMILIGNSMLYVWSVLKKCSLKTLLQTSLYYHILTCIQITFSMLCNCMKYKENFSLQIMILMLTGLFFVYMKNDVRDEQKELYTVTVYAFGQVCSVNAILDTGNMLREKKTNKMVCIVEKDSIRKIVERTVIEDYYLVPFHSVGQERGVLMAIETDLIEITREKETKKVYGVLLGVYEGRLASNGEFQMILHGDCLKGRNEYGNIMAHLFTTKNKSRSA